VTIRNRRLIGNSWLTALVVIVLVALASTSGYAQSTYSGAGSYGRPVDPNDPTTSDTLERANVARDPNDGKVSIWFDGVGEAAPTVFELGNISDEKISEILSDTYGSNFSKFEEGNGLIPRGGDNSPTTIVPQDVDFLDVNGGHVSTFTPRWTGENEFHYWVQTQVDRITGEIKTNFAAYINSTRITIETADGSTSAQQAIDTLNEYSDNGGTFDEESTIQVLGFLREVLQFEMQQALSEMENIFNLLIDTFLDPLEEWTDNLLDRLFGE
jgi:hypothetical protein